MFNDSSPPSIKRIAIYLPQLLIKQYEKRPYYTIKQVEQSYTITFKTRENLHVAFAMFCSATDFNLFNTSLNSSLNYQELRCAIAMELFEGWPKFNFDSVLLYAQSENDVFREIGATLIESNLL